MTAKVGFLQTGCLSWCPTDSVNLKHWWSWGCIVTQYLVNKHVTKIETDLERAMLPETFAF